MKLAGKEGILSAQLCERPYRDVNFSFSVLLARGGGIEFGKTSVAHSSHRGCIVNGRHGRFRSALRTCSPVNIHDPSRGKTRDYASYSFAQLITS